MGYRYGERKYSEGLYSRWPDWWRDKSCENGVWADLSCETKAWEPVATPEPPSPISPWQPDVAVKAVRGVFTGVPDAARRSR